MNSPLGLPIYFGIVALFFVPNLFLGCRAMCHCICWMAPFMVLGEKLGSALRVPATAHRGRSEWLHRLREVRPRVSDEPAGGKTSWPAVPSPTPNASSAPPVPTYVPRACCVCAMGRMR